MKLSELMEILNLYTDHIELLHSSGPEKHSLGVCDKCGAEVPADKPKCRCPVQA